MARRSDHVAAFVFAALVGCGHARDTGDGNRAERPDSVDPKKSAAARDEDPPPPSGFGRRVARPGQLENLQRALHERGFLDRVRGDRLDAPTQAALRTFQEKENLPGTGFPDAETVRRLGLSPESFFRKDEDVSRRRAEAEER